MPASPLPQPRKSLDDSDIGRLEVELKHEQAFLHSQADEAIESVTRLKQRLGESGRVRIKPPVSCNGTHLPNCKHIIARPLDTQHGASGVVSDHTPG